MRSTVADDTNLSEAIDESRSGGAAAAVGLRIEAAMGRYSIAFKS